MSSLRDLLNGIDPEIANGEFLAGRLPAALSNVLDTAHFAWKHDPQGHLDIVRTWIESRRRAR